LVSSIWVLLLFAAVYGLVLNAPWARGDPGTIYIQADGTVNPSTAPIQRNGDLYTFTDNIYDPIVVERSHIVIDGMGYAVEGTGADLSRGIDLMFRKNVTIRNMSIRAFYCCIVLDSSSGNHISGNDLTPSQHFENFGIHLGYSSGNSVSENNITANNGRGIYLWTSSGNNITGNNVANSVLGIYLGSSSNNNRVTGNSMTSNRESGLVLSYSSGNNISDNKVTANDNGIWLSHSSGNNISENSITTNIEYGVYLADSSSGNRLYHNNFITYTDQVCYQDSGGDVWDDGYPSGGNYWSDYTGVDEKSGLNQDQLGSDGIGDTPYIIDASNRDRYPLMNAWPPPERELSTSIMVPAWTKLGSSSFLNATVSNLGLNDETYVELVILINGDLEDSTTVSLLRVADSYTLVYQWTPTASGTYNVTAYVPPLPDEENTQNNKATKFTPVYTSLPPVTSFTYSPAAPIVEEILTFDASNSYDPDGFIISYGWEFGDGATGSGETVTHTYATVGSYTVSLRITDNSTDTTTSALTISIKPKVGVKAGDWIIINYTISGASSNSPMPQWLKMEFLGAERTSATTHVTLHMSDGTEQSETLTVDVVTGGQALGLSGFLIPANCATGDCIYLTGYGNVTLEGETTRTYAGAARTVVYASFSQLGTQFTYHWDKQTGVMVEVYTTSQNMTGTGKATETNMWMTIPESVEDGIPFWMQWWFYALVAATIIVLAVGIYFVRKRKTPTSTALSVAAEGT